MAKRSSTKVADTPEAPEAEVPTTENEDTVTTVVDEAQTDETAAAEVVEQATGENAEAEAEATESAEKAEPDISAVTAALDSILAGDISDLENIDFKPVTDAYATLDRAGKAAATRHMSALSPELLESGDFDKARVVLLANKATKAEKPKAEKKPRTPVDPTQAFVDRLASFQIAYALFAAGKPEGVADDFQEKVQAAFEANYEQASALAAYMANTDENKGDAPDASEVATYAVRIAVKPVRKPYGPRHDAGKHIEQVFAELPSGTFLTAGEIAGKPSEEYGEKGATQSAIAARFKGKAPLAEGLSIVTRDGETGVLKA